MTALDNDKKTVGDFMPALREGNGPLGTGGGIQQLFTTPLGIPTLADGATYVAIGFIAPCDGCVIKELWASNGVKIGSGTNTLAVSNYDASANSARNVLSAATIDPDTITALEGVKLTLTSTVTDLIMDEGDTLKYTIVAGTQSTAGQGYAITAVIIVPDLI
jgi:hypothetical protein